MDFTRKKNLGRNTIPSYEEGKLRFIQFEIKAMKNKREAQTQTLKPLFLYLIVSTKLSK